MANELTLSGSLAYSDSNDVENTLDFSDVVKSVATKIIARHSQSIATSDTALNLGSIGTLGYVLLINRDASNYVNLKVAASGTIIGRLEADGGFAFFKVGSGITAPALIADTSACIVECLLCSL